MSTRSSARLAHKKAKAAQSDDDEARDDPLFDNNHSGYHTLHLVRHGARDPSTESDESESEQQSPQNHRLSTAKKRKGTQGKKTRGQKGRLSELIHMPMEIFIEIMSHLMPVDVLALSRANKSFRKLLVNRTSVHIWHATMDNVPGLPPCPEGMSEPSYLAVLFLKTCTLCGDTARTGLDEVLVVRLCASCRSTSLTPLENVPSELLPFIHIAQSIAPKYQPSWSNKKHVLRESLTKLQVERKKLLRPGKERDLEAWEMEKKEAVAKRKEDGRILAEALSAYKRREKDIVNEKIDLRRSEIKRRLEELGWSDEDMVFSLSTWAEYDMLVEQPRPLTERIWATIKPKLITLLEASRIEQAENQRLGRMEERRHHLSRLCSEIQEQTTPELEIQVQRPNPLPPSQDPIATICFGLPFPSLPCLLSWPFLKGLHETEATVDDMEACFKANHKQVEDCIATWQSSVQAHFLDRLAMRQGLNIQVEPLQTTNIITTNGDPFANLSDGLKLLLRADSLFYYKESESSPTGHTQPETYRSILVTQGLIKSSNLQTFSHDVLRTPGLDQFLPYPEAQEMARMLLVSMGRRNASFLEMEAIGNHFGCGRCHEVGMCWNEVVLHYVRHRRLYLKVQEESQQLTDDGVIYNDIHSPEIQPSRPMTKFCLVPPINYGRALLKVCRLCRKIEVIRGTVTTSRPEMVQHLLDVHGIRKPKVKEHYTTHILPGRVSRCDEYGFPLYDGLKR